ncbi:J domain-containing protein [Erythrobacter sp. F6033]|uniref:J domain-containing protein n=1 Tax=Erythrobacter sp. F6033 TaxID=2926401 RepID=UPI001FF1427C|nr:J domain-containing protein [Erythrobacter sp. F6033]MCK0129873.1 J domain-containing protein [Erythrobacter sp. F6033]
MLRIAIILAIICILFRWAFGKWPWQGLGGKSTRSQAIFRARKLLGVEQGASRQQILAAHKRLISMVHPDKGGSNAAVHEANDARDLLLDELPDRGADIGNDGPSQD